MRIQPKANSRAASAASSGTYHRRMGSTSATAPPRRGNARDTSVTPPRARTWIRLAELLPSPDGRRVGPAVRALHGVQQAVREPTPAAAILDGLPQRPFPLPVHLVHVGEHVAADRGLHDAGEPPPPEVAPREVREFVVRVLPPQLDLRQDRVLFHREVLPDRRPAARFLEHPECGHPEDGGITPGRQLAGPAPHPRKHPLEAACGLVVVNVLVHVQTGEDELLDGEGRLLRPDEASPVEVFLSRLRREGFDLEGVHQPEPVEGAVAGTGRQAVAPQVVHPVHVELTGEQRLLPAGHRDAIVVDQPGDLRRIDARTLQRRVHLRRRIEDGACGPLLVIPLQEVLREVRERPVPDVVQHRRRQQLSPGPLGRALQDVQPLRPVDHLTHQVHHAERVRESRVRCPRVREVAHAQLVDSPQALHLHAIQQGRQPVVTAPFDPDVVVEGVAEELLRHQAAASRRSDPGQEEPSTSFARSLASRTFSFSGGCCL